MENPRKELEVVWNEEWDLETKFEENQFNKFASESYLKDLGMSERDF